jgi:hypothetical protein
MRIVEPIKSVKHDFFGVTLEIARAHSPAHIAKTVEATKRIRDTNGNEVLTDADYRAINAETMPGIVLVGWENFELDGAPVPFNAENAESLLLDDDYAYEFVLRHALNQEQFMAKAVADTKKKLSSVSGGN